MKITAQALVLASLFAVASPSSRAGTLDLSQGANINVSSLNIDSWGDLSFSDGRLWMSDGSTNGLIHAVNVLGTPLTTLNPNVIPGMTLGPDALTNFGATSLVACSSFGQSVAGQFQWTTSTLNTTYPSAHQATGAEFADANLWLASGTTAGLGSSILRVDFSTGLVLASVPVVGVSARIVDLAFDPFTGGYFALFEDDRLREIDVTTGNVLSTLDLGPFLLAHNTISGGIDFDDNGSRLFVGYGAGIAADTVVVLNRAFSRTSCGSGLGTFPCPCANGGATGRGCRNSVAGNTGALLGSSGIPRVGADTLQLQVTNLVPGTNALFFQGTTNLATPTVFGDGVRCVGGTVIRLAIRSTSTGNVNFPLAGDPKVSVLGLVPNTPAVRGYQVWYRDAASFCTASTFNLTNAIEVEWRP